MNKNTSPDLSNIAGLLNYGTFWSESRKKLLISYVIIFLICLSILVLAIVNLSIDYSENEISLLDFAIVLVEVVIACSLLPIILSVLIIINEKMRKKVCIWVKDAVKVEAYAKSIGIKNSWDCFRV